MRRRAIFNDGEARTCRRLPLLAMPPANGVYYAAVNLPRAALLLEGAEAVRWYRSSEEAQRGFCSNCGSALFWQADGSAEVSVMAGAFDTPSGLAFGHHIYCADKGDFYEISDGLPQYAVNPV